MIYQSTRHHMPEDLRLHYSVALLDHYYEIKALLHCTKANDTFSMLRLAELEVMLLELYLNQKFIV